MAESHLLNFVGFFFAGLAVNLTPCVYPMLTVTASLFKPKPGTHETIKHSFTKAVVYILGIALMYSSLGYFAASTGKIFGAALQNSWVLGGVALMMFTLALSMFGVFKLNAPHWVLNFLGGFRKANYLGFFISGMFVGVFAAPCIGPPVIALLAAVADNGDPAYGFLAFFIFSLGMGVPYLILGTFSGMASKLPKAGGWLVWVGRFFGVVLLGFALFYLSLALNLHVPQKANQSAIFEPYSDQRLNEAIKAHQPVLIDFFAQWCAGCHELDRAVFANPSIQAAIAKGVALRVDATNIDEASVSAMIDKYAVIGLPTVVFLDRQGQEIKKARVEGSESVKDFKRSLELWK